MNISQQAGAWLFRLKDDRSPECRAEFSAWLQTSPQHVAEFLLATATDVELGAVDAQHRFDIEALLANAAPNVTPLPHHPGASPQNPRVRRNVGTRWRWAIGLAAAAAVAIALLLPFNSQTYRTGLGEQRSVKLDDGSVVQLNTRSRIQVQFSKDTRTVRLLEGEALFAVAHEPARPFEVLAGTVTVEAIGTEFNVYRHAQGATVSVVEGRVKVTSDKTPVLLDAGQEAAIESSGRILKSRVPEVSRAVAWRQRQLEFRSATVAEVAAQFNRYNRMQIRVSDAAIANRRMSGLFDADEPQSLLDFLARDGGVKFEREGDGVTLRAE